MANGEFDRKYKKKLKMHVLWQR